MRHYSTMDSACVSDHQTQRDFSYKAVTTLIQICNKNDTDQLWECNNFVRISHRSGTNCSKIATICNALLQIFIKVIAALYRKSFCIGRRVTQQPMARSRPFGLTFKGGEVFSPTPTYPDDTSFQSWCMPSTRAVWVHYIAAHWCTGPIHVVPRIRRHSC